MIDQLTERLEEFNMIKEGPVTLKSFRFADTTLMRSASTFELRDCLILKSQFQRNPKRRVSLKKKRRSMTPTRLSRKNSKELDSGSIKKSVSLSN